MLLLKLEGFLKTTTAGSELRDGQGGIAIAMNLFEVDQLDAVIAIKTHSEEQLVKEKEITEKDMYKLTIDQIEYYEELAKSRGNKWTKN